MSDLQYLEYNNKRIGPIDSEIDKKVRPQLFQHYNHF